MSATYQVRKRPEIAHHPGIGTRAIRDERRASAAVVRASPDTSTEPQADVNGGWVGRRETSTRTLPAEASRKYRSLVLEQERAIRRGVPVQRELRLVLSRSERYRARNTASRLAGSANQPQSREPSSTWSAGTARPGCRTGPRRAPGRRRGRGRSRCAAWRRRPAAPPASAARSETSSWIRFQPPGSGLRPSGIAWAAPPGPAGSESSSRSGPRERIAKGGAGRAVTSNPSRSR